MCGGCERQGSADVLQRQYWLRLRRMWCSAGRLEASESVCCAAARSACGRGVRVSRGVACGVASGAVAEEGAVVMSGGAARTCCSGGTA